MKNVVADAFKYSNLNKLSFYYFKKNNIDVNNFCRV